MKLFRSIFIAVIVIVPGLARGEVVQFPKEYTMDAVYSSVFYNSMIQQLCVGGDGTMVFMGLQAIRINCTNGWKNNAKPTQAEFDKAYDVALSTAGIGNSAAEKSTKNTGTVVSRNTTSRGGSASGASASKTEATGKSKKSDDADTKSTDASDKKIVSHTFSVSESVNKLSGLTKKVAAEAAYRQYLGSKYCDGDGTITIRSNSTQIVCSNGWVGGTQPTGSQFTSEHKKALCYAECAGKEREYVSGTYGKCECSVTREEKRAANQQARDERKDARTKERADRQEERKKEKAIECEGRNPPMDIKQNDLGIWVCVDTEETIKKREEERKTNKTLDAFWNEMEDLERAFNKRVRQLRRDAKRDGGDK